MPKLVVRSGRNAGSEFKLNGERMIMGRRSACPIPIADPKSSREHAVIFKKNDGWFLQDLSRNGTLLNGSGANKDEAGSPMKFGDKIKIGDTVLELVDEKSEPINIEIPGYTILEKIGAGGMGTVYKARQLSMDRVVAMKVLNERYSSNSEFVDRFIREARAAGRLNHPNVIHVHDISKANGRHYFSMEFVDGSSIKDLLRVEKKIPYKRTLDIVLQCAKALEFAHENQIVHRDVKPDNIMLTKEGIVKIADLGIAKTFEEAAPSAKEHRRVMGTPHYMAPEQALGKPIDHRVDIYSLGATMYHMLTGTTPFNGNTAHEILKAHIQESLPPIQDIAGDTPDPVCFIVERMMAKLPEKRYASMSKLIEDIERVQQNDAAGIERLNVGESTIMRAVTGGKKKDQSSTRGPTDEVVTGAQTPVAKLGLALVLTAVFAATVAIVVVLTQRESGTTENPPSNPNPPTPPIAENPGSRRNAEAKKLMTAVKAAGDAQDWAAYEKNLRDLLANYPASPEADEASKLLNAHVEKTRDRAREEERKAAEAKLAETQKYETDNPDKFEDIVDRYQKAMAAAQGVPAVLDAAKSKVDEYKRKIIERDTKKIDDALRLAQFDSSEHKNKGDFDTARQILQTFIDRYKDAPQAKSAQDALAKVNADAQAKFKEVQTAAGSMEIAAALAEWDKYTNQYKDAATRDEVNNARQALETKAQAFAEDELKKASEKARKYEYADALVSIGKVQKKLAGTKWEAFAKAREEDIKQQKALLERVLSAAIESTRSGSVPIEFPIENVLKVEKWKLKGIDGDRLSLVDANNSALGFSKRLHELTVLEQYRFHTQFAVKKTPEDQKALEAFRREREITEEPK
ncbi:MAG TPA: protein kinase [Planctomycetota bacterium]|nr:protein kinase [Planctomycetota bacterium]